MLSETQKRAFLIADNRLTEIASWDDRLLAEQLAVFTDPPYNVAIDGHVRCPFRSHQLGMRGLVTRVAAKKPVPPEEPKISGSATAPVCITSNRTFSD